MNKEGFWGIDVDGGACAASMMLQGGTTFLLRAQDGSVTVALFSAAALPKGKTLRLAADDKTIDLPASFGEGRTVVFQDGELDPAAIAGLRAARQLRVLVDDRQVAAMALEGTGFAGAIDGVVACSKGEAGWWGKGVQVAAAAPATDDLVYNKEDAWALIPFASPRDGCIAQAAIGDGAQFLHFVQRGEAVALAVASTGKPLRRGRKGVLDLGGERFEFAPIYQDGNTYMTVDGALVGEPMEALRASKGLSVLIDGKPFVEVSLEGSGFPLILDELAACARGEQGWWTANAEPADG
ncbi:MAG: hypothetical protein DI570_23285 [Phenylobacterium zucineum]|nr:MAG: hypothetical protein DI570_23285 [Phenylobacterium zucineum]